MNFFKKQAPEPDNFCELVKDYILAKSNKSNLRLASVSDIMALQAIEKIIFAEHSKGNFISRLTASLRDTKGLPTKADFEKVRNKYRDKFDTELSAAVQKGIDPEDAKTEIMKNLRAEFIASKDETDLKVRDFALEGAYARAYQLKIPEPEAAIADYFHIGETESNAQGFLDYLIKKETGKSNFSLDLSQDPNNIVSALMGGIKGGAAKTQRGRDIKEKQKTRSTEETLKGGKADSADVTFGEGLQSTALSPEELAIKQEEEQLAQTKPTDSLKKVCEFFGVDFDFNALDSLLDQKEEIYSQNPNSLTDSDRANYNNIHNLISKAMDALAEKIYSSRIFERTDIAQKKSFSSAINGAIANIKDMYLIEGYAVSERPQELEEQVAPKAGSLSQTKLQVAAEDYYRNLRPHMIDSSKFLNKSSNAFFPFLSGIKTDEQREAAKIGDTEAMLKSGMSLLDTFKVKAMDLVHEWDVRHKWEGSGNKLSNTELKKNANDQFREDILTLASNPPYSGDNGEIRPEIMEFISTVTPPSRKDTRIPVSKLNWQMTQKGFDMGRINGELTRLLANLGKTSFAELKGMEDSDELNKELDKIVSEEAHYGTHIGLPGEEKQHSAYLPISEVIKDKDGNPVLDENNQLTYKQPTLQYFRFKPADFKNYLKEVVVRLIAKAEKLEKSPKNPPYAAGIRNPADFGIGRFERKTRTQNAVPQPAEVGTNLSQSDGNNESDNTDVNKVATYAFGQDRDPYGPVQIPVHEFAYDAMEDEKPHKKVKRFKVVAR
jgi:hypothetical protein